MSKIKCILENNLNLPKYYIYICHNQKIIDKGYSKNGIFEFSGYCNTAYKVCIFYRNNLYVSKLSTTIFINKCNDIITLILPNNRIVTTRLTDKFYLNLPIKKGELFMNEHTIPITNGVGSLELVDGTYTVSATANGYDSSTILPATQEVVEGTDEYSFTIAATGTLTLHVSDDGTDVGVPIVGATFVRCDAEGNTYGDPVTSNDEGNAVFNNVPFGETDAGPEIYYKQTASDGQHTFSNELQNTTLTGDTATVEITNAEAASRNFSLTDANYSDLPIADGQIVLTESQE